MSNSRSRVVDRYRTPGVRLPFSTTPIWRPAESPAVEVVGQGLIDLEVRGGVGLDRIEGGRLIEEPREEIALRWSAGGGM
jgi:hypothetical protein